MRRLAQMLCWLCAAMVTAQAHETAAPLRMGMLPYLSTQALVARYAPLQRYLEDTLKRPVMLVTAPNFSSYIERARDYEYDIYATAPHFAALAENESGYRRVGRVLRELDGTFIVRKAGPVHAVADLRGRTLATPDSLAIVTMLGIEALREAHLSPGEDVKVMNMPSHNAALLAVASGQADAAVASEVVFDALSADVRARLQVLDHTKTVPHMMYMASPKLSAQELQAVRTAILHFGMTEQGRDFFAQTGYRGIVPIEDSDMRQLEPYVKSLMQEKRP